MNRRFLSLVSLLAVFALIVAACSSDDADETTTAPTTTATDEGQSVLDVAVEAGQFSTLIALIEAADLGELLEGEGPFTLLAPTDAAFEDAFETLGITAEELLADEALASVILLYHVLPQEADSQLIATLDGQAVPTVEGEAVEISVVDGEIMVNQATVVSPDLEADNGIVHVINSVLIPPGFGLSAPVEEEATTTTEAAETTTVPTTTVPDETTTTAAEEEAAAPTIAEIVAASAVGDPAEFTVLLAALEAAGLVEALNNPGDELTVFAPTDAAFGALLTELGVTPEELLARPDLASILLYHVAPGVFDSAAVAASAPIDALATLNPEGATLQVDVVDGVVVINGVAQVIAADVAASNGVFHAINAVLVPPAA